MSLSINEPDPFAIPSVRDMTDGSTVLDHLEYAAFGAVASQTNAANGSGVGYTGLWEDVTAGIVNAEHRTFSVMTHYWIQRDQLSFKGGDGNLYRYVGNGATNFIDPSGMIAIRYGGGWLDKLIFNTVGVSIKRKSGRTFQFTAQDSQTVLDSLQAAVNDADPIVQLHLTNHGNDESFQFPNGDEFRADAGGIFVQRRREIIN